MKNQSLIYICISFLWVSACKSSTENKKNEKVSAKDSVSALIQLSPEQFSLAGIETEVPDQSEMLQTSTIAGVLELFPTDKASAYSHYQGVVKEILIHEGEPVKQGQVLMYLESVELIRMQEEYVAAHVESEKARQDFQRQEWLKKREAASEKDFQEAQGRKSKAEIRLRSLGEQLKLANLSPLETSQGKLLRQFPLVSPITGHCTSVISHLGSQVRAGESVAEIHSAQKLHASLQVPESMIHLLREGQEISLFVTHQNQREIKTTIHGFSKLMNTGMRTSNVFAWVEGPEANGLLPGMYVTAKINGAAGKGKGWTVSEKAIVMRGERKFIFVVAGSINASCRHELCLAHESDCPPEEDCPEHPECEQHEKCKSGVKCSHTDCLEHVKCLSESEAHKVPSRFQMIEVFVHNRQNGRAILVSPSALLNEETEVVTRGAYYLYGISMNNSEAGCCP